MGTVFSFDIRDRGDWAEALGKAVTWLRRVDRIFSTYRPDSDISRLRSGEVSLRDVDPLVHEVLDRCEQLAVATAGYSSARWAGATDPTGVVKGWAIARASDILRAHGSSNHAINGGGDIQTAGFASPAQPWRIGIADPFDRRRVLHTVHATDTAVATSGTTERGLHIVDPHTGTVAVQLVGATVICRSLTIADAYATAVVAMGPSAHSWVDRQPDVSALLVDAQGEVIRCALSRATPSPG